MAKKPIVIYHNNCTDGLAAAWCFWKHYGDNYEYYPASYNQPPPDVTFRDVYLVDFSYKYDVVETLAKFANKIVILDHHKSAIEDLWPLAASNKIDMQHCVLHKSGAVIAWEYVKQVTGHKKKMPVLLRHIQDRDLWHFKLPHTKEIMQAVFAYDMTFESYDTLMRLTELGIKRLIKEGLILNRRFQQDLKSVIETTLRPFEFEGYNVGLANVNFMFTSEAGSLIAKDKKYDFALLYCDTKNSRLFSLRSIGDFDVSKIAEKYNGGGHLNAAGFKVARDHPLAQI